MTLRLYPLPTLFDQDVALLKAATPVEASAFYLRRPHMVPWSVNPTTFVLETDEPEAAHTFEVNRTESKSIIPGSPISSVPIQLAKGANRIELKTANQRLLVTVGSTAIETWFQAAGREFYLSVGQRLREIEAHFNTPWTTRAAAFLLPYTDLFLPARMPKIHQTRLAILTIMGGRLGYGDGVLNLATAVSYSTPWVSKTRDSEFTVPGLDPLYEPVTTYPTTSDNQGRLLDLWFPNHCLATKLAITQLAAAVGASDVPSPKPLELLDADDRQVFLRMNGGETEVHLIDPLDAQCADIEMGANNCDPARVFGQAKSRIDVVFRATSVGLDAVVENPLGFRLFDRGGYYDSSYFDTVDPDDMFGTGFVGVSLSAGLDSGAFDTTEQVGRRMALTVAPLLGTNEHTPETLDTGSPLKVDAKDGAPVPALGATVFWGVSPRTYLREGDRVRTEEPDTDLAVVSAWPVFQGTVTKTFEVYDSSDGTRRSIEALSFFDLGGTVAVTNGSTTVTGTGTDFLTDLGEGQRLQLPNGNQYFIDSISSETVLDLTEAYGGTSATGVPLVEVRRIKDAFEPRFEGAGLRVADTGDCYCISGVSADGTSAVLTGNATELPGGLFEAQVYLPLRDRDDPYYALGAGRRTFEVTTAPLQGALTDGTVLDYRPVPRAAADATSGATVVRVASDTLPRPGDGLYLDENATVHVHTAYEVARDPTTNWPVYEVTLSDALPANLTDNEALYAWRAPSYSNGAPVTPLLLLALEPAAPLVP